MILPNRFVVANAIGRLKLPRSFKKSQLNCPRMTSGRCFFSHATHRGSNDSTQYLTSNLSSSAIVRSVSSAKLSRKLLTSTMSGRPVPANSASTSLNCGMVSFVPSSA